MKLVILCLLFGSSLQAATLNEGFYGTTQKTDLTFTDSAVKALMPHNLQGFEVKWLDTSHSRLSLKWASDPYTGVNYGSNSENIYRCSGNICIDSSNKAIEITTSEELIISLTYGYKSNLQNKIFAYRYIGKSNPGEKLFYLQGEGLSQNNSSQEAEQLAKLNAESKAEKNCQNQNNSHAQFVVSELFETLDGSVMKGAVWHATYSCR